MYYHRKRKTQSCSDVLDNKSKLLLFVIIFVSTVVLGLGYWSVGQCMGWPEIKTRLLPDKSFAVIESKAETRIRHCPHHDLNSNLDAEQLIYILGVIDRETWLYSKNKADAKKHLQKHYDRFKSTAMKKGLQKPVNINEAKLTELVILPQIGPVLAVRIVEYRNTHNMLYIAVEDIKKVEGIGQGIFYAIRHYVTVK